LGTIKADPIEYLNRYGSDVTAASDLPAFVTDIPTPSDVGVLGNTLIWRLKDSPDIGNN